MYLQIGNKIKDYKVIPDRIVLDIQDMQDDEFVFDEIKTESLTLYFVANYNNFNEFSNDRSSLIGFWNTVFLNLKELNFNFDFSSTFAYKISYEEDEHYYISYNHDANEITSNVQYKTTSIKTDLTNYQDLERVPAAKVINYKRILTLKLKKNIESKRIKKLLIKLIIVWFLISTVTTIFYFYKKNHYDAVKSEVSKSLNIKSQLLTELQRIKQNTISDGDNIQKHILKILIFENSGTSLTGSISQQQEKATFKTNINAEIIDYVAKFNSIKIDRKYNFSNNNNLISWRVE